MLHLPGETYLITLSLPNLNTQNKALSAIILTLSCILAGVDPFYVWTQ